MTLRVDKGKGGKGKEDKEGKGEFLKKNNLYL